MLVEDLGPDVDSVRGLKPEKRSGFKTISWIWLTYQRSIQSLSSCWRCWLHSPCQHYFAGSSWGFALSWWKCRPDMCFASREHCSSHLTVESGLNHTSLLLFIHPHTLRYLKIEKPAKRMLSQIVHLKSNLWAIAWWICLFYLLKCKTFWTAWVVCTYRSILFSLRWCILE